MTNPTPPGNSLKSSLPQLFSPRIRTRCGALLFLLTFAFGSTLSAAEAVCPRSAEYTIYLKGENHVNEADIAFRNTIEALSPKNLFHYCVEGTLPDNYLTSVYDPFQESSSAGNIKTLLSLEDPLTFLLALLFTYRDFALANSIYQAEVETASEEEKAQLQAVLNYYDFKKNLVTLITTNTIGYNLWLELANNIEVQESPELHNLFFEITKFAQEVVLLQDNEIEPVCANPEALTTLGDSFNWAVIYTYLIQELIDSASDNLLAQGVDKKLLMRFLFYPKFEEDFPTERELQSVRYQKLKESCNRHLRLELRNNSFINNLMHAFSRAKESRLPFIVILGNHHISEVYQALREKGYPVEVIFDNNRFLEEILGNYSSISADS